MVVIWTGDSIGIVKKQFTVGLQNMYSAKQLFFSHVHHVQLLNAMTVGG